ncbi:hypothetical protein ACIQTT_11850 [Microbacterium sp. NPDC090225]|uniref:hypothetical protein n=1 Tax=Microbacterium sp. NPDC090225 TaxID=3364207 RepID=UPI0038131785
MTEQTVTLISIAVAIALVIVSLAYGMNLGRLSAQKRETTGSDRRPSGFGLLMFFCAAMPGGIVFLWNRPLFEPVLQIVLLCIVPALIGYGIRVLLRRPSR